MQLVTQRLFTIYHAKHYFLLQKFLCVIAKHNIALRKNNFRLTFKIDEADKKVFVFRLHSLSSLSRINCVHHNPKPKMYILQQQSIWIKLNLNRPTDIIISFMIRKNYNMTCAFLKEDIINAYL